MKTRIAAIALAWIVSATPSFAANWKVWEGTSGSTQGQWSLQIQNSAITGQSQMTTIVGSQLDYKLTGSVQAGAYQIARTHSSDGQLCNYRAPFRAMAARSSAWRYAVPSVRPGSRFPRPTPTEAAIGA